MQNISLKSIKWESIKAIFNAISSAEKISRANISAETGLSLMTVGKVADALLGMHVVSQAKASASTAGRRAGMLSINDSRYAVILDLTGPNFHMSVINIRLDIIEKCPYPYNDDFRFDENLSLFFKSVQKYLSLHNTDGECIGIGVSVPGAYSHELDRVLGERFPALSAVPLKKMLGAFFPDMPIYIEAGYNAAAMSNISRMQNHREQVILYWFIGENNICGTVVKGGEVLRGAHNAAGNFGQMMIGRGRTLESAIKTSNSPEENASLLARAIYNVLMTVDPDQIIIECELYKSRGEFVDLVRQCLLSHYPSTAETLPYLSNSTCKFRHAHRGLTIKLREMWLYGLVFNDDRSNL